MRKFDGGSKWDLRTLNLLGQHLNLRVIDPGISLIHFILWKFTLIAITQVSLNNIAFDPNDIIEKSRSRIRRRIESARVGLRILEVQALARNEEPKHSQYSKWIRGIGKIENCKIVLNKQVYDWLYSNQ